MPRERGKRMEENLQQRLLYVREQLPALAKKNHNEEVSYDFVKIDDIYKYLTPAMNRAGVLMDVVEEQATRHDEAGNPVFVCRLPETPFWIYEADLKVVWKNADDPSDEEAVVLHAIGTNEMPDKAKGSAWTYCLKYYFFSKFAINQGAEDPDMNPAVHREEKKGMERDFRGTRDSQGKQETGERIVPAGHSEEKKPTEILTVEDARSMMCSIGINKGRTMGEIADGPDGRSRMEWFAYSYRGKDSGYRIAAGMILEAMDENERDVA